MSYTKTQIDDMIDRMLNPFRQDVVGTNSIAISASVEAVFAVNGLSRNDVSSPAYMTDRWNTSTNIMTAITEYDSPTYAADIGFVWTPDSSSSGTAYVRTYINDATPKLIRTHQVSYKGSSAISKNILNSWYWGSETGYDAKNDGVYFTIEFEHSGTISTPSISIYNTQ